MLIANLVYLFKNQFVDISALHELLLSLFSNAYRYWRQYHIEITIYYFFHVLILLATCFVVRATQESLCYLSKDIST